MVRPASYSLFMQTRAHKLVGIPVKTRSGQAVGRLTDVSLDVHTGRIEALLVRSRGFIPGLMDQELRIAWSQVISLSPTEAIVSDAFVPATGKRFAIGMMPPSATDS
jgi:sporulation protein YlmC with PRC-barrel domain